MVLTASGSGRILIKMVAESSGKFYHFFKDGWNIFDFTILVREHRIRLRLNPTEQRRSPAVCALGVIVSSGLGPTAGDVADHDTVRRR